MRRVAALLVLAAGCASPQNPPPESSSEELGRQMARVSQIAFDVTKLKRGEHSMYVVRLVGKLQPDYISYAVVDDDATSLWIENKVPAVPRDFVIKSRHDRGTGRLIEQWAGEAGSSGPAKRYPREGKKEEPVKQRDSSQAQAGVKEEVDQITVAGKTWMATKVTTTLSYPDGSKSVLSDWYHKDAPFSVVSKDKSYGGLLKRQ